MARRYTRIRHYLPRSLSQLNRYLSAFIIVATFILMSRPIISKSVTYVIPRKNEPPNQQTSQLVCVHPPLKLWGTIAKLLPDSPPLNCRVGDGDWVKVVNGTLQISTAAMRKHGNIICSYQSVKHNGLSDFDIDYGDVIRNTSSGFNITSDFFKVKCQAADKSVYENVHLSIVRPQSIDGQANMQPGRSSAPENFVNILMFGFDSTSRAMWLRKLPKSYEYLVNVLGSVVMEGYNIVGDGTPQALLPILTGLNEKELPEARRGYPGVKSVDGHPWIWKRLRKAGYTTQYAEDMPSIGTFHYRMLGFNSPPVDHYSRPFYLALDKMRTKRNPLCVGDKPLHVNAMNWVEQFFHMYTNKPKFSFTFLSCLTHDTLNVNVADNDLLKFLKKLNEGGYLDNTFLILMADHGARFSKIRRTVQGKQEERMPFMSLRLPPSFIKKYPKALRNLKLNANRLTTPYDIHETFMDVVNYDTVNTTGDVKQRGISLLKEIPLERTCKHAGIETHWCACLNWKNVSVKDKNVIAAVNHAVDVINNITIDYRSLCTELSLKYIISADMVVPNDHLLRFKKTSDSDGGFEPDLSDNMKLDVIDYQITFITSPGLAVYEVTLRHDVVKDVFSLDISDISRTNKYGSQPQCIAAKFPHMRQYCYCKVQ